MNANMHANSYNNGQRFEDVNEAVCFNSIATQI